MHTSTPSFGGDVRVAERLKRENSRLLVGMVGAHVAVLPEASLRASRAVDWVGVGEFDYACAEVAEGRPLAEVAGDRVPRRRPGPLHAAPAPDRGHGRAAVRRRRLSARPHHRELLHRLPPPPLRLALHGAGMPIQVHLLPVAPDRGRAPLPRAEPGERRGRDGAGQALFPPGPGVLLRRRHVHGRPAARRGDRPAAGPARASPGRATPRRTSRGGPSRSCGTTASASCWWATSPAISAS